MALDTRFLMLGEASSCLGDATSDASNLNFALAAASTVHSLISYLKPLANVDSALDSAWSYADNIDPSTDAYSQAYDAVESAQQDRDNYALLQPQAQGNAATVAAATNVPVTKSIDTGSGSVLWDTVSGTANDLTLGAVGRPGAVGTRGVLPTLPSGAACLTDPLACLTQELKAYWYVPVGAFFFWWVVLRRI